MRAWHLGVVLTIIGGSLFFYELSQTSWLYWDSTEWFIVTIGFVILVIGLWVLATKFRQWVFGH